MGSVRTDGIIGVILAAGQGVRIRPLSVATPKPLLPVCNKPIMQHQLEAMAAIGIRDVRIVVSHNDERIRSFFGDGGRFGVAIEYVTQELQLGIAHAVLRCEDVIDRPFMVFLGDVFLVLQELERMVALLGEPGTGAVLAVKREEDPRKIQRNFTVSLRHDGSVGRVVEKPRHPASDLKGCGIYLFDLPAFDAIRRTPKTAMRDEYEITNAIQILIDDGATVRVAEVVTWDMNVTTPCDLLTCNRRELARRELPVLVAESARVHPGARIEGSVIGDGAQVLNPVRITDCLVFPGAVVDATGDLHRKLVTPEVILSCPVPGDGERATPQSA